MTLTGPRCRAHSAVANCVRSRSPSAARLRSKGVLASRRSVSEKADSFTDYSPQRRWFASYQESPVGREHSWPQAMYLETCIPFPLLPAFRRSGGNLSIVVGQD